MSLFESFGVPTPAKFCAILDISLIAPAYLSASATEKVLAETEAISFTGRSLSLSAVMTISSTVITSSLMDTLITSSLPEFSEMFSIYTVSIPMLVKRMEILPTGTLGIL